MQGNAEGVKSIRAAIEAPAVKESLSRTIPVEIRALDLLSEGNLDGASDHFDDLFECLKALRDEGGKFVIELPRAHYFFGAALRALGHENEARKHLRLAREYIEADRRFRSHDGDGESRPPLDWGITADSWFPVAQVVASVMRVIMA